MANSLIQRAFSYGEISPELAARADLPHYASGLKTCRNFTIRKPGGVQNRAGFKFCGEAGEMEQLVKLYRWTFTAANQSLLIEAGHLYIRFWLGGARVTVEIADLDPWDIGTTYEQGDLAEYGGVAVYAKRQTIGDQPDISLSDWYSLLPDPADPAFAIYEIPTPYDAGAFNSPGPLHFAQSGAIITITHPAYAPMELQNLDVLGDVPAWVLVAITTSPSIAAPANLAAVGGAAGGLDPAYVVTAVDANGEESLASGAADIAGGADEPVPLFPNVLTWDAVTGAVEYRMYKDPLKNGTFGRIGVATGQVTFKDGGVTINPIDFTLTPPQARVLFNATNDYPSTSTFYQQRRMFADSGNEPETVWGSRIGFRNNFSIRSPLQDDDAVTFKTVSEQTNVPRHLIALKRLLMLTNLGEFVVRGDESGALTPTSIKPDQEGRNGASLAFPALVGNNVVFVQERGSIVRDIRFTNDLSLIDTRDLTVYAGHLFEGYTIERLEAQISSSLVWGVRSDGVLLSMTYLPELDLWGWSRHDTAGSGIGAFEDICVVPEQGEDVLYAIVRRDIDGDTVRYIERLASRVVDPASDTFEEDVFFVDCGATYNGAPTATITGLDHLEGEVVAVVGDGEVIFDGDPTDPVSASFTVTGGEITLPAAKSIVHVGLRIAYGDLETLSPDVAGNDVRDRRKVVKSVALLIDKSVQTFRVGPDEDNLGDGPAEAWETATDIVTKRCEVPITTEWGGDGRIFIRHDQPMPLTILGIIPSVTAGG